MLDTACMSSKLSRSSAWSKTPMRCLSQSYEVSAELLRCHRGMKPYLVDDVLDDLVSTHL